MSGTPRAPWPPQLGRLTFGLTPAALREEGEREIESIRRELSDLVARADPPTLDGFLAPLDCLIARAQDVEAQGSIIFSGHPDAATRLVGREVAELAERFLNGYRLNEAAYGRLKALDLSSADEPTRFAVGKMLREMRRAGVEASPEARTRLLETANAIDRTSNQFMENIARLDRSIAIRGAGRLSGLPSDFVAAHAPDAEGSIRITTKYPDYQPVMAYAEDGELRRQLLEAFMTRAYPENEPVLGELLALRARFATDLGYGSWAAYALEDKMMGTPAAAQSFLGRLGDVLREPTQRELARYLARKRREHPDAVSIDPWECEFFGSGYYDNKIRKEEFGVDARVLRAYLPFVRVRDGLLALCRELFDIEFVRVPDAEVWHPSVEAYDVARAGVPLGRAYLDLIPREGKFNHAACFGVRTGLATVQYPQAALLCNFLDPTVPVDRARMEWRDVVTFFHEFGHLLHAMLAGQPRWLFNGQSQIEWDFIEAPSQLFEEWARDPATLARFARDPDTGEGIPADLLRRLESAEAMGRASRQLRQVALAWISLDYYAGGPPSGSLDARLRASWDRAYPRPIRPEYHPEAAFGHLTGYSACYYTYLWSGVIARDLLSPFHARGTLTDRASAARYAEEILAPGSSRPASELIRRFLGREFRFDAYERWALAGVNSGPAAG